MFQFLVAAGVPAKEAADMARAKYPKRKPKWGRERPESDLAG